MVIGTLTKKYNNDVLYVLGYTMDNRLHYDILVMGIPIEEPSDVYCG